MVVIVVVGVFFVLLEEEDEEDWCVVLREALVYWRVGCVLVLPCESF